MKNHMIWKRSPVVGLNCWWDVMTVGMHGKGRDWESHKTGGEWRTFASWSKYENIILQALRVATRYAPPLSSPVGAPAPRAPRSRRNVAVASHAQYVLTVTAAPASRVKDHRQRIPRFVIRRYLEKSIQKKLFWHLQSLQIKTIFQEKKDYKLNFRKFTVAVYLWSWRHWCQLVNKHRPVTF